jgi:hypothetical protein
MELQKVKLLQHVGMNPYDLTYQQTNVKSVVLSEHNITTEDIKHWFCICSISVLVSLICNSSLEMALMWVAFR